MVWPCFCLSLFYPVRSRSLCVAFTCCLVVKVCFLSGKVFYTNLITTIRQSKRVSHIFWQGMARLLVRRLTLSVLGFQSSMATLLVSTHFSSENSHLFLWNHRESKLNLWMTFRFVHVAKLEKGCLMKKTKLNANRGGKRTKTLTKKSDNVTEHWSHTTLNESFFFFTHFCTVMNETFG